MKYVTAASDAWLHEESVRESACLEIKDIVVSAIAGEDGSQILEDLLEERFEKFDYEISRHDE